MYTTQLSIFEATIAESASLSDAFNIEDGAIVGLVTEGGWDAAVVSFLASVDGGTTFYPVFDSNGNEITVEIAVDQYVAINPSAWPAATNVKIRSGTSTVAVAQTAERKVKVVYRRVG